MKKIVMIVGVIVLVLIGVYLALENKMNKATHEGNAILIKAKQEVSCLKMTDLTKRLYMFMLDNTSYPSTEQGIEALVVNPSADAYPHYPAKGYLRALPKDAWGNPFSYAYIDNNVVLMSYGADAVKGGTSENKDIYLSECK